MSTRLGPVLEDLLTAVVDALAAACTPVEKASIETGALAWDWCCEGHAYVRVPRIHPANPFPQQALRRGNCALPTAVMVEVGVLRCGPTMDGAGNSPDPEDVSATSLQVYDDAATVYEVLRDFQIGNGSRADTVIDAWEPFDPQGGCVGGSWVAWIDPHICAPSCTSPTGEG